MSNSARNRLLGCLPGNFIVSEEAKAVIAEISAAGNIPENRRPRRSFAVYSGGPDDDFFYNRQGIPIAEPQNKSIADLIAPVQAFESAHLNSTPTAEAVSQIAEPVRALRASIDAAPTHGVHPKMVDRAWGTLAEAAERISRVERTCSTSEGALAKQILMEAARHPDPAPDADRDERFAKSSSWSSGTVRIEAAQGIMRLAGDPSCADETVLNEVSRLAEDPVAPVRYQVCQSLNAMYYTDRDRMWHLVANRAAHELNCGVLQVLLSGTFDRLFYVETLRIADLSVSIFERVAIDAPGAKGVRERCVELLAGAYARTGHEGAARVLTAISRTPSANGDVALVAVRYYRDTIVFGPVAPADPDKDAIRGRALGFVAQLLHTVLNEHASLVAACPARFAEWPEDVKERFKELIAVAAGIGSEMYFGSGAYGASNGEETEIPVRARFFQEAGAIIEGLADVGEPSLAHHLLETAEFLIPVDAARVFLLINRIVRGGKRFGYQYDTLSMTLVVKLVERYLADYRPLLRENQECRRALMETLDIFVSAGWPAARALAYRLDEMYRS